MNRDNKERSVGIALRGVPRRAIDPSFGATAEHCRHSSKQRPERHGGRSLQIVHDIFLGQSRNGRANLAIDERGMISLATCVALMLVTVLVGLVANTGHTVNQKIEIQNAADASTYSSTLWMARGMNTVTATNHAIGELMAIVVIEHSFGGEKLDGDSPHPKDKKGEGIANFKLEAAKIALQVTSPEVPPIDEAYNTVRESDGIESGATILDAKMQLKQIFTGAYVAHAVGAVLAKIQILPPVAAAGLAMQGAALVVELKCWQEYALLNLMESTAKNVLNPIKEIAINAVMPAMLLSETVAKTVIPAAAFKAAKDVAGQNRVAGSVHPKPLLGLSLPIVQEDQGVDIERSQLMRASYPWVISYRDPIMTFMGYTLTLSGAKRFYRIWTHRYALEKTDKVRSEKDMYLYVMEETRPTNVEKGTESWTTAAGSGKADELFTLVGFAQRPVPPLFGGAVYGNAHPEGIVCYAQGMFYNANPQQPGGNSRLQPQVGWDTLNWDTEQAYRATFEFPGKYHHSHGPDATSPGPKVKLNWQAKLVPVTRLTEAAFLMEPPFRGPLTKVVPDLPQFRTH